MSEKTMTEIRQHVGWLKQYVHGASQDNWRDMMLRAERQLDDLSAALDRDHAQRVTGCVSQIEEAACLIWAELCPGMVMGDADLPHYENAAKAVLALAASPAPASEPVAKSVFDWLSEQPSLELSYQGWDEDACWQVHRVTGGRNDREWTLLAEGLTPFAALLKARALLGGPTVEPPPVHSGQMSDAERRMQETGRTAAGNDISGI